MYSLSYPLMHNLPRLVAVLFFAASAGSAAMLDSTRMIESIISRQQGIVSSGAVTSTLESGILSLALESWLEQYPSHPQASGFSSYLDQVLEKVLPTFTNANSSARLPLDRLSVGQALLRLKRDLSATERDALSILTESLKIQQRNPEGGLWYYVYRNWSYLDGTFSFLPFMAAMPSEFSVEDGTNQISLLFSHCFDNATGLLVHGYDDSKTAVWANPVTGASPYVWGRSMGWYLTGLVNTWEVLLDNYGSRGDAKGVSPTSQLEATIKDQMRQLSTALIGFADNATGAWWQLPTYPGRKGNFLESSSTALFTAALLKARRLGLIDDTRRELLDVASRAYNFTQNRFVLHYNNNTVGFNGTVAVCSLNSSASYEYYTSRPILENGLLGEAAYVLASLEIERVVDSV